MALDPESSLDKTFSLLFGKVMTGEEGSIKELFSLGVWVQRYPRKA